MEEIKLNKKEKEDLKPLVEAKLTACVAFNRASVVIREADERLWERILKSWPKATHLKHASDKSDWIIAINDI